MPRDSGDDAYAWLNARDRAAVIIDVGSKWKHRKTNRRILVVGGGFIPGYEAADSRVRYCYVKNGNRTRETDINRFMKMFEYIYG